MIRNLTLVAAGMVLLSGSVLAAGKQDFDLVNKTGYPIEEVYVAPSSSDDWQEDVLGEDVLESGKTVHIRFNRSTKTCKWDLKVVYTDKETAEWDEFDLCETSKIIIKYNRKSGETSAEYE
ncbi:MAG: hypothetical protein AB7G62_01955 [Magnetospirillum sp.]